MSKPRFYYESDGDVGHRTHYVCDRTNPNFRRDFPNRREAWAYRDAVNGQDRLEREVEGAPAACRHVYAPCDPVCIHCGCKLPMPPDREYNAFGSMVEKIERTGERRARYVLDADQFSDLERHCTCCGRPLKGKVAMLELDQRTDTYHDREDVPADKSQGWFPFGMTCALRLRAKAGEPPARAKPITSVNDPRVRGEG